MLLCKLAEHGEVRVSDLARDVGISLAACSHNLSKMREEDILTSRREGQTIWYALDTTVLEDVLAWSMDMARGARGEK